VFSIAIFVYIYVQQERSSVLKKLATLKDLDCDCPADKIAAADVDQSMQLSMTGLETFCLNNKVLRL
jgi:gamma-tubulin complex component 2